MVSCVHTHTHTHVCAQGREEEREKESEQTKQTALDGIKIELRNSFKVTKTETATQT